jgi:hypothetical protein
MNHWSRRCPANVHKLNRIEASASIRSAGSTLSGRECNRASERHLAQFCSIVYSASTHLIMRHYAKTLRAARRCIIRIIIRVSLRPRRRSASLARHRGRRRPGPLTLAQAGSYIATAERQPAKWTRSKCISAARRLLAHASRASAWQSPVLVDRHKAADP